MAYKTNKVHWQQCQKEIKLIREKVFVCEFHISPDCEFDTLDQDCEHVLLKDEDDQTIATGRICQSGKISRVAVLMKYRKTDAAKVVINKLLDIAKKKGLSKVYIDCELDDVAHYQAQGFRPAGAVFMQGGVAKQPLANEIKQFHCQQNVLH